MLVIIIATFVVAYVFHIVGTTQLNAGYTGRSRFIEVNDWQKCQKLIRAGWVTCLLSLVVIVTAAELVERHYPAQWGWGVVSVMLFLGSIITTWLVTGPYKDDNPYNPSPPPRVW